MSLKSGGSWRTRASQFPCVPVTPATVQQRLRHSAVYLIVFNVCYGLGNALAQHHGVSRDLALPLDSLVPFWPWMIVPYLSSGLWLALGFLLARQRDDLVLLSHRLLLATLLATVVFLISPFRFSPTRPPVDHPLWAPLFALLAVVDRPYNQLPSLHVAYCLILWPTLRGAVVSPLRRAALAAGLLLTAAATLFTWQHHLLDLLGGALLGGLCITLLRPGRQAPYVAFHYSAAALALLVFVVLASGQAWAGYGVLSLLLVALAYARQDPHFLRKRRGRHSLLTWLLYAPYLAGYRLSWWAVRWHGRHQPAFVQTGERLWLGRRLSAAEASLLPADCSVIDLAPELSELPALAKHHYQHLPLLDLITPAPAWRQQVVNAVQEQWRLGRPVYLHCAMGYQRCHWIALDLAAATPRLSPHPGP